MINLYESVDKKFNNLKEDYNDVVHIYDYKDCKQIDPEHTRVVIHGHITPAMSQYFANSSSGSKYITHLTILNENRIGSCFSDSINLLRVDAPQTTILDSLAFTRCRKLKIFNAPYLKEIGSNAFRGCYELHDLKLSSIELIDNSAFGYTKNFKKIILPDHELSLGMRIFEQSSIKFLRIYQMSQMNSTLDEMYELEELTFTGKDPIETSLFYNKDYIPKSLKWVHVPYGVQISDAFKDAIENRNGGKINYY